MVILVLSATWVRIHDYDSAFALLLLLLLCDGHAHYLRFVFEYWQRGTSQFVIRGQISWFSGKVWEKSLSFFPRLAKSSLGLNSKLSVLLCLILTRPTFHQDLCWGHASQAQARRWHTAICLLKFCHWHPEARHGGLWCTWSTSNFIGWFCLGLGSQMSPTKLFCRDRAPERLPPATWEWYKVFLGTCLFPPAGAFFSKKRQTSLYCPSFFMVQVPAIEWATELAKHILSSRC